MKFSNYKYERPIYEEVKKEFISIIDDINNSCTYKEQKENIKKLNILRNNVETMSTLSSIRHSINTLDEFYEKEREYWDEYSNRYTYSEELNSLFYKSVINSKFKENIANDFGKQFIDIADYSLKSFSSEIIKDLQEENKLCSRYTKLLASAKIDFEGEERNLSGMGKFMSSTDREVRIKASKAYYNFFEENEDEFDNILMN